jgi:hypothetical protein
MCNIKAFILALFFLYTNLAWPSSYKIVSIDTKTTASIIHIEYPQGFSNEQINLKIQAFIDKVKKPYFDAVPEEFDPDDKNTIDITFRVKSNNSHVLSIIFYVKTYMSGGAHASVWVKTLNFIDGEGVKLEQLFKSKSNYLSTISKYCYTNLLKIHPNDSTLEENLEPRKSSYTIWYFNKTGLVIVFEPSQFQQGPFGPITLVTIPYTILKKWPCTKKAKIIELSTYSSLDEDASVSWAYGMKEQTAIVLEKHVFYSKDLYESLVPYDS